MWCRADGDPKKHEMLDFDNMANRPIRGTTDWKKYDITIDVPKRATSIAYGVQLAGTGAAYFRDVKFEVVGESEK